MKKRLEEDEVNIAGPVRMPLQQIRQEAMNGKSD